MKINELTEILIEKYGDRYQGMVLISSKLVIGIDDKDIEIEEYSNKTLDDILAEIEKAV